MLKIITSLAAALIGLLANAQVSETRKVSSFNKIEITDQVEVIYTQSENFSVKAEASDALGLSTLLTQSKNNTLKISCHGNGCELAKVYVSAPQIVSVKAGKKSKITVLDKMNADDFSLSLSSGARFNGIVVANNAVIRGKSESVFNIRVEAQSVSGYFHGDTKVNLSGIAEKSELLISGNVLVNARNLVTKNTVVTASDNADVLVYANRKIDINVADNAKVKYFGMPQSTFNKEAVAALQHKSENIVAHK